MTSDRIDELLKQTAYPESNSVKQAMLQVWNELQQDFNSRTCESCKHYNISYLKEQYCDEQIILPFHHDKDFSCNKWEKKDADEKSSD